MNNFFEIYSLIIKTIRDSEIPIINDDFSFKNGIMSILFVFSDKISLKINMNALQHEIIPTFLLTHTKNDTLQKLMHNLLFNVGGVLSYDIEFNGFLTR
jgi:hypothetical protein